MTSETLTVGELLNTLDEAVLTAVPGPVWVRGEVSGLQRTNRGAVFFRLVDPELAYAHEEAPDTARHSRTTLLTTLSPATLATPHLTTPFTPHPSPSPPPRRS